MIQNFGKAAVQVIELSIPHPDLPNTEQISIEQQDDIVYLTDQESLLKSRVATHANQKTIELKSIAFDQDENKKTGPRGNTDSEPESGAGFPKVENASNISSIYSYNTVSKKAKRAKRDSHSTVYQQVTYPDTNNYVLKEAEVKPSKLAQDACAIHQMYSGRSQASTTVLCFALLGQEDGIYIRKFVTSNNELLNKDARHKAHELGYKVIRKQLSHAEGGMIQFLQEREDRVYNYFVSMGCSRLHCKECDIILKLALGTNYVNLTAAIDQSGAVKTREEAVSSRIYQKFVILNALKNFVEESSKLKINIEVGSRFDNRSSTSRQSVIEDKYDNK